MNGWIIGFGLVGTFAGAAVGVIDEMTRDWNGGQRQKGDVKRMVKKTFAGAAAGAAFGWLVSGHGPSPEQARMDECYKNAPAGTSVTVVTAPGGQPTCSYTKP